MDNKQQVLSTTSYGLFNRVVGNREVDAGKIKRLETSILEHNLLHLFPIIVDKNYSVYDGQHRLKVAEKNNLEIYYIIDEELVPSDIIRTNSNKWNWSINDYLEHWIELGKEDYVILKNFTQNYNLSPSLSMVLLGTLHHSIVLFKQGRFVVKNVNEAIYLAEIINRLKPYCEKGVWKDREFVFALVTCSKKIKLEKLVDQASKYTHKLQRRSNLRDYLLQFQDVYNFRNHIRVKLY